MVVNGEEKETQYKQQGGEEEAGGEWIVDNG
jgi:hypothetical protein